MAFCMKKPLKALLLLLSVAAAAGAWLWLRGGDGHEPKAKAEAGRAQEFRYAALDVVAAHTALVVESPAAKTVFVAGGASAALTNAFARAGLSVSTNATEGAKFDLVFAAGNGPFDWSALSASAAGGGAFAWLFDVRKKTAAELKGMLDSFPCGDWRLWMPGENDWLVTGRVEPSKARLDEMMERFSAEDDAIADLAAAGCGSLAQLFANYAGSCADVEPAFGGGDLSAQVRPQFFISCEIPDDGWIDRSFVDDDIAEGVMREIRSMQVVRRVVVEGNMLALEGNIDEAMDRWHSAMLRNPGDTMLMDRLYLLAVNARAFENVGNLSGAAKCYETMVAVRPNDVAALRKFAACMRKLGKDDVADAAERRARELAR